MIFLSNFNMVISLVPHGYQVDLITPAEYANGTIEIQHSECRDYGVNIDPEKFSSMILNGVRQAEHLAPEEALLPEEMTSENLEECKLCGEETFFIFNIKFDPVPICETCARAVYKQQSNFYLEFNSKDLVTLNVKKWKK